MRLYFKKNCYIAAIESQALINIRIRYTCFGVAYPIKFIKGPLKNVTLWKRLLPRISLGFCYHTAQNDQWMMFSFRCNGKRVGYRTKGERKSGFVFKSNHKR